MKQNITERLQQATVQIWEEYYNHPFILGIEKGDLPIQKFRFYTIQDYLYLVEYTKVFAIGMTKTSDPEQMQLFAQSISQLIDFEMNLHQGYLGRLEITREELSTTPMTLENRSYTSYMLNCAYQGGIAQALTAVLACALSYQHIGEKIVSRKPDAIFHPLYGEWIATYTSEQYAQENKKLCDALNRIPQTEQEYHRLEDIFSTCAQYEKAFWDMAWSKSNVGISKCNLSI